MLIASKVCRDGLASEFEACWIEGVIGEIALNWSRVGYGDSIGVALIDASQPEGIWARLTALQG